MVLDEIEKAHPNLFNILPQVMDHATLTDNNGKQADFRNVILIMTTNAGAREMSEGGIGFQQHAGKGQGRGRLSEPSVRSSVIASTLGLLLIRSNLSDRESRRQVHC